MLNSRASRQRQDCAALNFENHWTPKSVRESTCVSCQSGRDACSRASLAKAAVDKIHLSVRPRSLSLLHAARKTPQGRPMTLGHVKYPEEEEDHPRSPVQSSEKEKASQSRERSTKTQVTMEPRPQIYESTATDHDTACLQHTPNTEAPRTEHTREGRKEGRKDKCATHLT